MIKLRFMKKKDIDDKVRWSNDPVVNKYIEFEEKATLAKTKKWFENKKNYKNIKLFIIEIDGKSIGYMRLDKSVLFNRGELHIVIGEKEYWGKGYGKAAMELFMKYCFNVEKLNKIILYVMVDNECAIRLYNKLGFIKEGLLKRDIFFRGKYKDRLLMSKFRNG